MKIDQIYTIPEMEKQEDGYIYPEKYHNKLFIFKDQFIYFRTASYDTFPKMIIDGAVKSVLDEELKSTLLETQEISDSDWHEIIDQLKLELKTIDSKFTEFENDMVQKIIDEKLASMFQNINRVIDNLGDKIANKIDLTDLQVWRSEIEKSINNLVLENISSFPKDSVQNVMNRLDTLEMQPPVMIDETKVMAIIHRELKIVKDGIQSMVDSAIEKNTAGVKCVQLANSDDWICSDSSDKPKSKLKITTIALLRESGLSMAEIAEARDFGLI